MFLFDQTTRPDVTELNLIVPKPETAITRPDTKQRKSSPDILRTSSKSRLKKQIQETRTTICKDYTGRAAVLELEKQRLSVCIDGFRQYKGTISTGKQGYSTPTGEHTVLFHQENARLRGKDRQTGERWDVTVSNFWGFADGGAIGLHPGNISTPFASHGCGRVQQRAIPYLLQLKNGDKVIVKP